MPTYESEAKNNKSYAGNVVVEIGGKFFAVRAPDSGLDIPYPYSHAVESLVLNPTTIDPKQVSSSISSTSLRLLDRDGIVSRLVKDRATDLVKADANIYLGRTGVGMAFSDYKKLPTTRIAKVNKPNGQAVYQITTKDSTERMNVPIYDAIVRLNGEISPGTTTIFSQDSIADFPANGFFKLDNELISYASKDDTAKGFYGCARGELNTTPAAHEDGIDLGLAEVVTANPIDILLRLLTSGSGAGSYDFFADGLAIGQSLVDVAGMESIRDELFDGVVFSLAIYNQASALKFLETEILAPCNLRFVSKDEKIALTVLDSAQFVDQSDVLDHDTLTETPDLTAADTDLRNQVQIDYNFDEGTQQYLSRLATQDDVSVAQYGKSASVLKFQFKGVQDAAFVATFAAAMLARFAYPNPTITCKTQMDKSLLNVGDKTTVETTALANEYGELNFANSLEIVSRAINWENGEVTFKLAYTSFTGTRLGYISPSDLVHFITDQSTFDVLPGRGDFWLAGWKVRLWDTLLNAYTSDPVNEIASVNGDTLAFVAAWSTTLATTHELHFADFDDAVKSQRRYAFVGKNDADFSRLEKVYSIVP